MPDLATRDCAARNRRRFISIIDSLLGSPKIPARDRSNRLLDAYVPLNGAFHLSLIESTDDDNDSIFRSLAAPS
jgi:hypothetical protein